MTDKPKGKPKHDDTLKGSRLRWIVFNMFLVGLVLWGAQLVVYFWGWSSRWLVFWTMLTISLLQVLDLPTPIAHRRRQWVTSVLIGAGVVAVVKLIPDLWNTDTVTNIFQDLIFLVLPLLYGALVSWRLGRHFRSPSHPDRIVLGHMLAFGLLFIPLQILRGFLTQWTLDAVIDFGYLGAVVVTAFGFAMLQSYALSHYLD